MLLLHDLAPAERTSRIEELLGRVRLVDVSDPADFDEGYRLLDAQFGPVNEIERREILERWLSERSLSPKGARIKAFYRMLLVRDLRGQTLAVRDSFSAVDPAEGRSVALMSHSLVLPEHRRSGLGALLRAAPVSTAREDAHKLGIERPEILLVAEMELARPGQTETLVRLAAYEKGGFRVVPPRLLPYAQPDFRDLVALGVSPVPIPFLLLVRQVGEEDKPTISARRAIALIDALDAIHGPSVGPEQLALIRAHALETLTERSPDLPLLPLPRSLDDRERTAMLSFERNAYLWPEHWHGAPPPPKERP